MSISDVSGGPSVYPGKVVGKGFRVRLWMFGFVEHGSGRGRMPGSRHPGEDSSSCSVVGSAVGLFDS